MLNSASCLLQLEAQIHHVENSSPSTTSEIACPHIHTVVAGGHENCVRTNTNQRITFCWMIIAGLIVVVSEISLEILTRDDFEREVEA